MPLSRFIFFGWPVRLRSLVGPFVRQRVIALMNITTRHSISNHRIDSTDLTIISGA